MKISWKLRIPKSQMWNQKGHNIENDIWLSWSKLEYSGMHSAVVPIYDQRFVSSAVNMDCKCLAYFDPKSTF